MICWKSWKVASGFKLAWCIQPKIALPNADYKEEVSGQCDHATLPLTLQQRITLVT